MLLTLAAAVIVIVGFYLGRSVVGPFVLAAVIVIIVHPLRHPLEKRGVPRWLATTAVIVAAYLILAVMAVLIAIAATQFISLLTQSSGQVSTIVSQATTALHGFGIDVSSLSSAGSALDPATLITAVKSVAGYLASTATAFFFILAYIIFMGADAARLGQVPARFARAKSQTIASFREYTAGVQRYYVVNANFGLVVAVLDGLLLWALGVPGAFIWAVLAFVTNFIPNIGFVLGLIPAAVFALISGGWVIALVVVVAYCVINVTLQELVQPKFVSDAVNLSLTLTFASVIFWVAVIGPLGALLAIPLTLLVRTLVIGSDPDAGFARWLTGDYREPASAPTPARMHEPGPAPTGDSSRPAVSPEPPAR
ncbi:AI-2E family transporter [Subtercola lobariae]|uniref:AI-2E family transporter n=1 Tax=Subtercola lobariae TaxID=1588641 RepID=A0A917B3J2_9MICO|nr:AI-2E family transporter [Subtercola lobariae]